MIVSLRDGADPQPGGCGRSAGAAPWRWTLALDARCPLGERAAGGEHPGALQRPGRRRLPGRARRGDRCGHRGHPLRLPDPVHHAQVLHQPPAAPHPRYWASRNTCPNCSNHVGGSVRNQQKTCQRCKHAWTDDLTRYKASPEETIAQPGQLQYQEGRLLLAKPRPAGV